LWYITEELAPLASKTNEVNLTTQNGNSKRRGSLENQVLYNACYLQLFPMTYQHLNEMILGDFSALLVFMIDF